MSNDVNPDSSEDISGYLSNKDSSQLATMCGVLKRELTAKRQESKKLRLRMHEMNVNSQKESRIKNLENAEVICKEDVCSEHILKLF